MRVKKLLPTCNNRSFYLDQPMVELWLLWVEFEALSCALAARRTSGRGVCRAKLERWLCCT